jgi:hypothetical protein
MDVRRAAASDRLIEETAVIERILEQVTVCVNGEVIH